MSCKKLLGTESKQVTRYLIPQPPLQHMEKVG